MGLAFRDRDTHTYGEYRAWPDDTRYELIDGTAYLMAPAPSRMHQDLVLELARQIADRIENSSCRIYIAPFDVRLPKANETDEAIDTVVQPDLSVVCDPAKLDDQGCRGAPDWILEVVSPSTAAHDQLLKRDLYERCGVREYWIVHPTDRLVIVYRAQAGGYGKPMIQELAGNLSATAVPNAAVSLDRLARLLGGA